MAEAKDSEKKIVPLAQDPAIEAAKAALEAIKQTASSAGASAQIIMNGKPFRQYSRTKRIKRRNQGQASLWLRSPGLLALSTRSEWMVLDNAQARGAKRNEGEEYRLCVGRFDDETLYLWATDSNNPDGFEIKRHRRQLLVNIADYLFEEGLVPEPGLTQKFDLLPGPEPIHGLPALCIYLKKAVAKRHLTQTPGELPPRGLPRSL